MVSAGRRSGTATDSGLARVLIGGFHDGVDVRVGIAVDAEGDNLPPVAAETEIFQPDTVAAKGDSAAAAEYDRTALAAAVAVCLLVEHGTLRVRPGTARNRIGGTAYARHDGLYFLNGERSRDDIQHI